MSIEKYVLTSGSFIGSVVFGFQNEFLVYYENDSEMNVQQLEWLLHGDHFPFTKLHLEAVKKVIRGSLELVPPDLSFNAFWDAYKKKVNRKRCEPLWRKMIDPDKIMCLMSIQSYDAYLKRSGGRAKLDPENYLKKESFRTNWNQIQS